LQGNYVLSQASSKATKSNYIYRHLVFWFLIIAIIPLVFLSTFNYFQAKNSIRHTVEQQLSHYSLQSSILLNNWFENRLMDVKHQALLHSSEQLLKSIQQSWKQSKLTLVDFTKTPQWKNITSTSASINFINHYKDVYDTFLIDGQGNILFSYTQESDLGTNLLSGKYAQTKFANAVKNTLVTGKPSFSGAERYSPSDNDVAGFIFAPILNKNKQIIGAFAIQLTFKAIAY